MRTSERDGECRGFPVVRPAGCHARTALAQDPTPCPSSFGSLHRGAAVGDRVESESPGGSPARRWFRRVVLFLVVPYLALVLMFGGLQRSLMYLPTRVATVPVAECGLPRGQVHEIEVPVAEDLVLNGWLALADGQLADDLSGGLARLCGDRSLLLYFPGNAGHRGYRAGSIAGFAELGLDVVLVDYRGFAENAGKPTEAALHADARGVQLWLADQGIAADRLILFGESLGSAVAVRLAADLCRSGTPPAGLLLRAPFSSMTDTACHHYPWLPVRWVLVDRYQSIDHIGEVNCPVTIVHGTDDQVVPIHLSRELFEAAPPRSETGVERRFIELPGVGHNAIPLEPVFEAARGMMAGSDNRNGDQGHAG